MGQVLACICSEFPKLSETFVERELRALQDAGLEPAVVALAESEIPADDARRAGLPPVEVARRGPASSVLKDLIYWLLKRPLTLLRSVVTVLEYEAESPKDMLWVIKSMPGVLAAARRLETVGVRHVYAHFANAPTTLGAIMARLLGVDFSFSAHARDVYLGSSLPSKMNAASVVIVCNQASRIRLTGKCGLEAAKKIRVAYHGTDLGLFVPRDRPVRCDDPPLLLAAGRLVPKKGFDVLVRACAMIRDSGRPFRCSIVGDGPERRRLEELAQDLDVARHVTFVGWMPYDRMPDCLNRADIVAVPSIVAADGDRDGIPNVAVEAMACGRPVVASNLSGIPELVEDGINGLLVKPGDPAGLFDAVVRLLDDPVLGARMGTAGRAKVEKQFDAKRNVALVVEALKRALSADDHPEGEAPSAPGA